MNICKILTPEGGGHAFLTCGNVKSNVHPVTSHEDIEVNVEV
jgi:hypothetical protein